MRVLTTVRSSRERRERVLFICSLEPERVYTRALSGGMQQCRVYCGAVYKPVGIPNIQNAKHADRDETSEKQKERVTRRSDEPTRIVSYSDGDRPAGFSTF